MGPPQPAAGGGGAGGKRRQLVACVAAPQPGKGDRPVGGQLGVEHQGLVVVEAMKMQNEIKSPKNGVVKQIFVKKGQSVNSREKLMVIE